MSKFSYKARDSGGQLVTGEIEAASDQEVAATLNTKGLVLVELDEKGLLFGSIGFLLDLSRVSHKEQLIFFKQLGVLIPGGVPIYEALAAVEEQLPDGKMKRVTAGLRREIELGSTFSQALARYPEVFSPLMVTMIAAGEKGGLVDEVIQRIILFLEKDLAFKQKVQGALRYPIIVLVVLAIAFVLMITFILPRFQAVFSSFKTDLPLPTRILISINYVTVNYWWLALISLVVVYYSLRRYFATEMGRRKRDAFILTLPVLGLLVKQLSLARFFRMFSSLISSGVPIEFGLEVSAKTADNLVIAAEIMKVREQVVGGSLLSAAMKQSPIFPPPSVHMVAVGEKSGTVDAMLNKSADYFSEDADYLVGNLMSLFEPLLILVLALFVMLFAAGVFLPMWGTLNLYAH